jgi:predicted nucleic-acid-binding protein
MIAFDTNLLVRFLADDDKVQADIAEALMGVNTVFLSRTVLLETEWVLRVRYRRDQAALGEFFQGFLDAENVVVEDADQVARALTWYRLGADFADALHLAACGSAMMHTFDRKFCKAAREAGMTPEIRVLEAHAGE